ncbi:MAG: efflux RND transporter periplasmic adaptor subunit [Desulfobulbus sp.]|nr:MAG: efflux RND transporter periplasmic adaptor subunit [Desulfobulbus sp.]
MDNSLTRWQHPTGVLVFFCLVIFLQPLSGCKKVEPRKTMAPAQVSVINVEPKTVPADSTFVAEVRSSHQVEIVARVNGFLDKILYREGEVVEEGQTLFLMDQKPFNAKVAAARSALASNEAQLWTAQANLQRIRPLAELDAASKSDLDNAIGAVKAAEAAVMQAKAHLEEAELNLGYTVIKSPVTGVSGDSQVREGAFLTAGMSGSLTYVARLDPVWVTFSVSQNQWDQYTREIAEGRLVPAADRKYQVEILLSDGSPYPHRGKMDFVSPSFNQQTSTFMIRAEIPNPDGLLRPGMFVKAIVKGVMRPNVLTVPQKAVLQTGNGHAVFVVSPQGTAEIRPVIVGEWVGSDWIISQGLNPGEEVVVDGFQRLAPGMPVQTQPAATPAGDPVPGK